MDVRVAHWVNHEGGAIYSIDAHPVSKKFVTCGQGKAGSAGQIVVWNYNPLSQKELYESDEEQLSLCTIRHDAGANCVRWSSDGKRFAVASDDTSTYIYEYCGRVQSAGSVIKSDANVERYKEHAVLRGHSMEVLCVEWSPEGRCIASSSMDNTIIIWNAKKLPDKLTTLSGHSGAVKGVAWDPIGKYLASLSADKSLKLWKTDNWACDSTITSPFEQSSHATVFSRLDWTPDGQFLMVPTSTNNTGPTTQLVERKNWALGRDLVGHRKATTCVRALPKLFHMKTPKGIEMNVSLVAVGSRDKSLSIWLLPGFSRPLATIQRVFNHSVMDFGWMGSDLIVCSQDGTVKVFSISNDVIGSMLDNEQMSDECEKLYSIRPARYRDGEVMTRTSMDESMLDPELTSFIETPQQLLASKKNAESEKIMMVNTTLRLEAAKKKEEAMLKERSQQVEEKKDGKRRIQPVFMGSTQAAEEVTTVKQVTPPVVKKPTPAAPELKERSTTPPAAKRSRVDIDVASTSSTDETDNSESDSDEESSAESNVTKDVIPKAKRSTTAAVTVNPMLASDFKKPQLRSLEPRRKRVDQNEKVLDRPEVRPAFVQPLIDRREYMLEVENTWKCGAQTATRISLIKRQKEPMAAEESAQDSEEKQIQACPPVWTIFCPSAVLIAAANRKWAVVGCDHSVRFYCAQTGISRGQLLLDAMPVDVGISDNCIYVLTETAKISTWDLQEMSVITMKEDVTECLSGSQAQLQCITLSEKGVPMVTLTTGNIYTFSTALRRWQEVEVISPMLNLCESLHASQLPDGSLGRLLKATRRNVVQSVSLPPAVSKTMKEGQLEAWMNSAEAIGSSKDYKKILTLYVETLVSNGNTLKLKSLMASLERVGSKCGMRTAALRSDALKVIEDLNPTLATSLNKTSCINRPTGLL